MNRRHKTPTDFEVGLGYPLRPLGLLCLDQQYHTLSFSV